MWLEETFFFVNGHRRDGCVRFEEEGHKYFLLQSSGQIEFPVSVSGVWARNFERFDPTVTIRRYFFDGLLVLIANIMT